MALLWPLVGFLVGWLITLVADRWPRDLPFSGPRCLNCDTPRARAQAAGLSAYLTRQTACRRCGARIAARNPLVEVATALLFAYLATLFADLLTLLIASFHTAALVLVCVIDFEHRLILNRVMFPAIALSAALAFVTPNLKPQSALAGAFTGFALTGLIYLGGVAFVWVQARRGHVLDEVAFGQGDVVLMLYLGLITGLLGILRALALGVVFGGVVAGVIAVAGLLRRQSALDVPFAYGPYLSLAGWIVLIQNLLAQ